LAITPSLAPEATDADPAVGTVAQNQMGFDRNAYLFILMLCRTPKLLNFMGLTFGTAEVLLDGQQPKDVRGTD